MEFKQTKKELSKRILYSAKLSFKNDSEINTFPDKDSNLLLQEMAY